MSVEFWVRFVRGCAHPNPLGGARPLAMISAMAELTATDASLAASTSSLSFAPAAPPAAAAGSTGFFFFFFGAGLRFCGRAVRD